MGRKGWVIAAVAAILIVGSLVALTVLTGQWGYKTMTGPVGIVQGPVPTNGFLAVAFGPDTSGGATIAEVMPGSGAEEAGLRAGDVIVAVADVKEPNVAAVQRATEKRKPGDMLAVTIRRDGQEHRVSVRLISFEEIMQRGVARDPAPATRVSTTNPSTSPAATP